MPVTLPLRLYAHIETIASQDPAVRAEINACHVVPGDRAQERSKLTNCTRLDVGLQAISGGLATGFPGLAVLSRGGVSSAPSPRRVAVKTERRADLPCDRPSQWGPIIRRRFTGRNDPSRRARFLDGPSHWEDPETDAVNEAGGRRCSARSGWHWRQLWFLVRLRERPMRLHLRPQSGPSALSQ